MSKKWLLALPILFLLLSCEGFSTGGNPDEGKCSFILREHPTKMTNNISMHCSYDSICRVTLFFGLIGASFVDGCIGDYEYRFVQNKETKINLNSSVGLNLDSDDHARFSLFDINNVEKKYDIDLSEIIHPYTVKGDSIEIKMPSENFDVIIACPYCSNSNRSHSLCGGSYCRYEGNRMSVFFVGTDSSWGKYFTFHYGLTKQSSMLTDSIYIHGTIEFR